MNKRNIRKVLDKKHKEFVESIKDNEIKRIMNNNAIITGGAIASMLLGEIVNDYDYYLTDFQSCNAVAEYYVKQFNEMHPDADISPKVETDEDRIKIWVQSAGIASPALTDGDYRYFENVGENEAMDYVEKTMEDADEISSKNIDDSAPGKEPYRPVFLSANAITLSDKVQIIIRFYGDADKIHENYDFVHCTNYYNLAEKKLVLRPAALESLLAKELQYMGSKYPVCSIIRTRKFLRNGWKINAGQYLKMCFQVSELNLTNMDVLEDQLTGVDAAYFKEVIQYCKKAQEEREDFQVTVPYLGSIIDKIFG